MKKIKLLQICGITMERHLLNIFLGYFKKNNNHIKILGEENIKALIETNNPAIFISGHFANFELMSMEITKEILN